MVLKRWILIGVINALLLSGAFQFFVGNKAVAQVHANNTTNLDDPPSESLFLPLVIKELSSNTHHDIYSYIHTKPQSIADSYCHTFSNTLTNL